MIRTYIKLSNKKAKNKKKVKQNISHEAVPFLVKHMEAISHIFNRAGSVRAGRRLNDELRLRKVTRALMTCYLEVPYQEQSPKSK
jgi:hypothetical protein